MLKEPINSKQSQENEEDEEIGDSKEKMLFDRIKGLIVSNYLILTVVAVAIVTRFFWIDRESVWNDEVGSILFAEISGFHRWGNYMFTNNWTDSHPIFYYSLLHYWVKAFGTSEFSIRGMSAIFGILIIISTFYISSELINKKVGIVATILVLANPINLYYSQEARMYILYSLLIMLSSYFFYKSFISEKMVKFSILYIITAVSMLYTEYLGFFVLGIHLLFGLFYYFIQKERKKMITLALIYGAIFLLFIPWLWNMLRKYSTWGTYWMRPPTLRTGGGAFLDIIGIRVKEVLELDIPLSETGINIIAVLIGLVFFTVFLLGIAYSLSKKTGFNFLLVMICIIPVVMFIVSVVLTPIFSSKQISSFQPEFAMITATGFVYGPSTIKKICSMKSIHNHVPLPKITVATVKNVFKVLFILLIIVNCINILAIYTVDTKRDWRAVTQYVEDNAQEGDIILVHARYSIKPFNYYYEGDIKAKGIHDVEELETSVTGYERVWLVLAHEVVTDPEGEIPGYLDDNMQIVSRKEITTVKITLYENA